MRTIAEYEAEIAALKAIPDVQHADFAWDSCLACEVERNTAAWLSLFAALRDHIVWFEDE